MSVKVDYLRVDKVDTKPKYPKYNSGSLKVGDKWYSVAKNVDINTFEEGNTYACDIEKNERGYETVIKNRTAVEISPTLTAHKMNEDKPKVDWAAKDRSQLVGGRSHDAVELVKASYMSGKVIEDVLVEYQKALEGILTIAERIK